MGEERVEELVAIGVRARAQPLLELGELGGGSVCIVDVRRLNDVRSVVPWCDVAEVGDSGDGVRVDPCGGP